MGVEKIIQSAGRERNLKKHCSGPLKFAANGGRGTFSAKAVRRETKEGDKLSEGGNASARGGVVTKDPPVKQGQRKSQQTRQTKKEGKGGKRDK